MKRSINYIESKNLPNFNLFPELNNNFSIKKKIDIGSVKIDSSKFAYKNPIYQETIDNITNRFDINSRDPILIDKDGYLLDGQHRLQACQILGIAFIDALVQING